MQHALLSALRNIAIPQQNKAKLVESGLVQLAISMLENDHPSVVYKLLGTLRMLVDNQGMFFQKYVFLIHQEISL